MPAGLAGRGDRAVGRGDRLDDARRHPHPVVGEGLVDRGELQRRSCSRPGRTGGSRTTTPTSPSSAAGSRCSRPAVRCRSSARPRTSSRTSPTRSGPSFCATFRVPTLEDSASTPVAVNRSVGWYQASATRTPPISMAVGHADDGVRLDQFLLQGGREGDRLLHRARLEGRHHRRVHRHVGVDRVRVGRVEGVRGGHREHLRGVRVEHDHLGAARRRTPAPRCPGTAARCTAGSGRGSAGSSRRCAPGRSTVLLAGLTLPMLSTRVGDAAVLAGEHVVVLGLDARGALAVGVHRAEHVRGGRAPGVLPLGGGLGVDAGQAERGDLLGRDRRQRGRQQRVLPRAGEQRRQRPGPDPDQRGELGRVGRDQVVAAGELALRRGRGLDLLRVGGDVLGGRRCRPAGCRRGRRSARGSSAGSS